MSSSYQDLVVWQKAVDLSTTIYDITKDFPKSEVYGLRLQIRRAVVSVPSNIAEGQGRSFKKEFRHFINLSLGSLFELETQIIIAEKVGYLESNDKNESLNDCNEIKNLLFGLRKSLFSTKA